MLLMPPTFYYNCMNGSELFTCSRLWVFGIMINLAVITSPIIRLSRSISGESSLTFTGESESRCDSIIYYWVV